MAELDLNRFDAVLLDLDGTLVDTLGDFVAVLSRMLADLPAPYATAQVRASDVAKLIGKGSENLIKAVLAQVLRAQPDSSSTVCRSLMRSTRWPGSITSAITNWSTVSFPWSIQGCCRVFNDFERLANDWPV